MNDSLATSVRATPIGQQWVRLVNPTAFNQVSFVRLKMSYGETLILVNVYREVESGRIYRKPVNLCDLGEIQLKEENGQIVEVRDDTSSS